MNHCMHVLGSEIENQLPDHLISVPQDTSTGPPSSYDLISVDSGYDHTITLFQNKSFLHLDYRDMIRQAHL